ncbi:MAG: UPF0182 family protein [Caldilineaceae bacterium]|nr:UPF0182 family protein [Caldilineaceae bacterium]
MRNTDPFSDLIRSIEENLQRGEDWIPPNDGSPRRPLPGRPSRWWWLLVIPFIFLLLFNSLIGFLTNWTWHASLGFESILWTRVLASLGLFAAGFGLTWLFLALNYWIVRRIEPFGLTSTPVEALADVTGMRISTVALAVFTFFSFLMGLTTASEWPQLLLFLNQSNFGVVDPVFGRDISFYVFTLPVLEMVRGWFQAVLIATMLMVVVVSGIGWRGWRASTGLLLHLGLLGALFLGLLALGYQLDAAQLVYSGRGAVFGAGYTDVNAQLPAYNLLTIVTLVAAVLLVITAYMRRAWRAIVAVLLIWVGVTVIAGSIYPSFVQRFQVSPNELSLERPFIENNIRFTRLAYDLTDIEMRSYDASQELTPAALLAEPATVRNIRLWDYRPLLETYNQVQALRQYYAFNDVDVDRYVIDGERRQVMVAARELVADRLTEQAQTWVNRRLVYTHGFGVAMSPVELVTPDGLPEFYIKDLPPVGNLALTEPQLYFGELTNEYVIGHTKMEEFSYPQGDGNVTTSFSADTGIDMTFWHRLLFAVRFGDINLILNQDITDESQLLWRRNIVERVQQLAPFLQLDQDPYLVVGEDGRLYWMMDTYVTSNRFPYSEPYSGGFNYIRNTVKIVINAYDGSPTFYITDATEPITAAYARIFPKLFQPFEAMPDFLQRHIRYPTDLFSVQAEMYRMYHMTNSLDFYNREDVWAWPEEIFYNKAQPIDPYYVLMELPDSDKTLNFMQIFPFTPANRENMVAWMAAQSDPDKYGEKIVYNFGKDSLFFGPKQIEARIDQDPLISAQLSLWNQQGSSVIRGNLLIIPLGDSLLYVEPLYLQAQSGRIPELRRVILATSDRVVMAENLGLALVQLFGRNTVERAGLADLLAAASEAAAAQNAGASNAGQTSADELGGATLEQLIVTANRQYTAAQAHLRSGDWAAYGDEMDALQATLQQLVQLTGVAPVETPAAETPAAETTPAPTPESAE